MPAPRMRDISISRANPAMRLTMVRPPIVPVALWRFMASAARASGFRWRFGRRLLAAAVAALNALLRLHLRDIGAGKVDRVEQEWREAAGADPVGDDLAGRREGQARRC